MKENETIELKDKFSDDDVLKLRSSMPHGYVAKLKAILLKKYGKEYKSSSIRRGLMPEYKSSKVIAAALDFLEQDKLDQKKYEEMRNNM